MKRGKRTKQARLNKKANEYRLNTGPKTLQTCPSVTLFFHPFPQSPVFNYNERTHRWPAWLQTDRSIETDVPTRTSPVGQERGLSRSRRHHREVFEGRSFLLSFFFLLPRGGKERKREATPRKRKEVVAAETQDRRALRRRTTRTHPLKDRRRSREPAEYLALSSAN